MPDDHCKTEPTASQSALVKTYSLYQVLVKAMDMSLLIVTVFEDLNKDVPEKLIYLSSWFPVGRTV